MKIRRLMTWALGSILLSLPMMCMHAGDGHHTGYDSCYSSVPPQNFSIRGDITGADDTDPTKPSRYGKYPRMVPGTLLTG